MRQAFSPTQIQRAQFSRLLQPDSLPALRTLILLGESASRAELERLWGHFRIINAYGPAECTTHATINAKASSPDMAMGIGEGRGAVTWVVDPDDYTKLAPLGAIGELLLEGPILARGYLDNPQRTAAAFIRDPPWLLRGTSGYPGRRGRLYKTGDLVRWGADGSLSFVGRKDTQVKIRGQRLELGEVEHHVRECVPSASQAIAEVVELGGEKQRTMLAVFMTYQDQHEGGPVPCRPGQAAADVQVMRMEADVETALSRRLPTYMIPAVYLRVAAMPLTASGKTDRIRLREMGSMLSAQRLAELHGATGDGGKRRQRTSAERCLQGMWAKVLGVDAGTCIGLNDDFFRLGGDSIRAVELAGTACKAGLSLAAADVFRYPTLGAQARLLGGAMGNETIPPFSLLGSKRAVKQVCEDLAALCGIQASHIQDAYPCTPLQEGLLSLTARREGDYVRQAVLELSHDTEPAALRAAWEEAIRSMTLLRTRIVPYNETGFLQLVTDEQIHWIEATGLDQYLDADRKQPMGPGQPLARYATVSDDTGTPRWFVWTVHHALYDGWSMNLIKHAVDRAYQGASIDPGPRFQTFIKYIQDKHADETMSNYWRRTLTDCECVPFPTLPPTIEQPVADEVVEHRFSQPRRRSRTTTMSTLVRAAWALIAGRMANSDDVVFGATVSGRSAPVSGIEAMAAPTIATVPRQSTDMMPFEQAGLHHISKICPGARQACMFQTLLVIQPQETSFNAQGVLGKWQHLNCGRQQGLGTYALTLEVHLEADTITASATFDPRVMEPWVIHMSLKRLEYVMYQLDDADPRHVLAQVDIATPEDLERIWEWNNTVPAATQRCIHEMIEDRVQAKPTAPAVCSWDGELVYGELNRLATRLAVRLLDHGIEPNTVVPLCFEKSMWATVAMLGVLKAGANVALLTPSVAQLLLSPAQTPELKTILFGGEALRIQDVSPWWGRARVMNLYGPSCVGELLLEGPLVGRGYLNDPENTAAAFIEDPAWLLRGAPGQPGRHGRLYKTGDLVRYNEDGSLAFVHRKDAQVKIRGQRVELGEVEHWIRNCIPEATRVVAEVLGSETMEPDELDAPTVKMLPVPTEVEGELAKHLPSYMVPTVLFSMRELPMTATEKMDRKQLREIGSSFSMGQLVDMGRRPKRQPSGEVEQRMQSIWAQVLNMDACSIGLGDSFFQLGGDSVAAMRVVAAAREAGISLTVADIFGHPTLAAQAQTKRIVASGSMETIPPFSLLGRGRAAMHQQLCEDLAALCGLEAWQIEDAYPCTPLQEGLLSLTAKGEGSANFVMQATLELSEAVQLDALRAAWEDVVRSTAILRTRIVQHQYLGLVQVVCREDVEWILATELEGYLDKDRLVPMRLGSRLSRLALVRGGTIEPRRLVWTAHHALYDGWSWPLTMDAISRGYQGHARGKQAGFNAFVKHVTSLNMAEAELFWRSYLAGGDFAPFPALPASVTEPAADATLEADFTFDAKTGLTASTLMRGALAVVISQQTGSADVIFGAVVSGRSAPVAGIDNLVGPTIATVPVRVRVPREQPARDYLETVQRQAAEMIPYEQTGLQHIARISESGRAACRFQTLLVVQPPSGGLPADVLGTWRRPSVQRGFSTYAVTLECLVGSQGVTLRASFDTRVVDRWSVDKLLQRLGAVLERLSQARPDQSVGDMGMLTTDDERTLCEWNRSVPAAVERCVHNVIAEHAGSQPDAQAIHAWDGELKYGELDELSTRLACHLVELRLGPGTFVPLCLEKSMWTVVAMLAVLKAGAAFVLVDPALPDDRLRSLFRHVHAAVCITSPLCEGRVSALTRQTVVLCKQALRWRKHKTLPSQMHKPSPNNAAYAIFTWGSTGGPKGYVVEHQSYCSAALGHGAVMAMSKSTRALQLGSYACTAAITEMVMTLIRGGCICIPSEEDRGPGLARAVDRLGANWALVTPTMLATLSPEHVPSLRTVCVGGEPIRRSQISEWAPKVHLRQTYGSAATCAAVSSSKLDASSAPTDVGRAATARCWIVDPANPNQLMPIGAPGEIVLEGPAMGREYVHEPDDSSATSVAPVPSWRASFSAACGTASHFYRTGDLASYGSDGSIHLLGSKDMQAQRRGRGVDMAEVEHRARLSTPDVKEAVVEVAPCLAENGQGTSTELIGFLLFDLDDGLEKGADGREGGHDKRISLAIQRVRDRLEAELPYSLVPSILVPISKLPLTMSGKTDRRRLREVASALSARQLAELRTASGGGGRQQQQRTEMEQCLQGLWSQLLGISLGSIRPDDSFFRLGGDSIGAMRLVAAARKAGIELAVADIFRHPRLHHMASHAVPLPGGVVQGIPKSQQDGPMEQSFAQERLWFLDRLRPGLTWFLVPCAVRLRGPLRLDALNAALLALERRHESLRTTFASLDGVNTQTVHPFRPRDLNVVDIQPLGDGDALVEALQQHQSTPFDLLTEPGWRVSVYRMGSHDHALSIVMHHIISDGWSIDILRRELAAFYSAAIRGQDPLSQVRPLPIQYRDASAWQKQQD
ncbi:AMP-binding enzyme [Hirsutella rhossiliensis]|uniref:AMP-binding enzyme domain-containing protein n=1 Tax=Hirsutella rhossiliensis TaxID=111463 RepID=A0A9P8MVU3_9HYPO|nr:AMP-binding enzyme domain-containing protein [Hirsutella rhossiliensis]KAH0961972.1 AMP-binding enzyme domain-containing protein [Hirsutella rhossiliensis]